MLAPLLSWVLVLGVGVAVRMAPLGQVFIAQGTRFLGDSDPNYHVLQAERLLHGKPYEVARDPLLNWPDGASVPWPPLFDLLLARSTQAIFGPNPAREDLERVAAVVPVLLAVMTLILVGVLARRLLGGRSGAGPALLVALLGAHVEVSALGRADQHVMEVLIHAGMVLGFILSWDGASKPQRFRGVVLLGTCAAVASWSWLGSAVNLVPLLAFAGVAFLLLSGSTSLPSIQAGLAAGLALGAALLAASLVLWGQPGALQQGQLHGVGGMHVALLTMAAASAAILLAAAGPRAAALGLVGRVGVVAAAAAIPWVMAVASVPWILAGVETGLRALGTTNRWYDNIGEFRPLLWSCHTSLEADVGTALQVYGLTLPVAFVGANVVARRWSQAPEARPRLLWLLVWGATFLALALLRRRFAPYLALPLAILAWHGIVETGTWLCRRLHWSRTWTSGIVVAGLTLVVAAPMLTRAVRIGQLPENWVSAAKWLATRPVQPGREGVLPNWDLGHLILYYAGRPVVASPFGTDGGTGAMEDTARVHLALDSAAAEEILHRRRIGFLVMRDPVIDAYMEASLAAGTPPLETRRECSWTEGKIESVAPDFLDRVGARLFYFDGQSSGSPPRQPLDGFRLVYESPPSAAVEDPTALVKIFEVVPGATAEIIGADPLAHVVASTTLFTTRGRRLRWETGGRADPSGRALVRLPYATGRNGSVTASPWIVEVGARRIQLEVDEEAVQRGIRVRVSLPR